MAPRASEECLSECLSDCLSDCLSECLSECLSARVTCLLLRSDCVSNCVSNCVTCLLLRQLLIDFQCAKRPETDLSAHDDASGLTPSSRVVPSYLRAARQLGLAHLPLNTALEPPSSLVALPVALQAIARSRNRRISRVRAGGSLSRATASRVVDGAFREENLPRTFREPSENLPRGDPSHPTPHPESRTPGIPDPWNPEPLAPHPGPLIRCFPRGDRLQSARVGW